MDIFETYSTTFPIRSIRSNQSRRKSSVIPGISTLHSAIYSTSSTSVQDSLISFVSYVKTQDIPILPVTKPDIRTVLGQGASFLVNGCEVPHTYVDPATGSVFPQGMVVAFKRAILNKEMSDPIADRIRTIFNELLTMHHPPLRAHPNIVKLHGVGFETEGPADSQNAMPVLIVECAELGNLAEVLETARKEDRALSFDEKVSLCIDIAHGLEILHACGQQNLFYSIKTLSITLNLKFYNNVFLYQVRRVIFFLPPLVFLNNFSEMVVRRGSKLTSTFKDIVHGDVKCENILIFEKENETNKQSEIYESQL